MFAAIVWEILCIHFLNFISIYIFFTLRLSPAGPGNPLTPGAPDGPLVPMSPRGPLGPAGPREPGFPRKQETVASHHEAFVCLDF